MSSLTVRPERLRVVPLEEVLRVRLDARDAGAVAQAKIGMSPGNSMSEFGRSSFVDGVLWSAKFALLTRPS